VERLLDQPATQELPAECWKDEVKNETKKKTKERDENRSCRWMAQAGLKENKLESPLLNKFDDFKATKVPRFKEPLRVSQRLNISG